MTKDGLFFFVVVVFVCLFFFMTLRHHGLADGQTKEYRDVNDSIRSCSHSLVKPFT